LFGNDFLDTCFDIAHGVPLRVVKKEDFTCPEGVPGIRP